MLELISRYAAYVIALAAIAHVVVFIVLKLWADRDRIAIAQTLRRFTDGLPNRSNLDWHAHLSDQIEGFLADINDVLSNPKLQPQRELLNQRMQILDERRDYLQSLRFETAWNVARTMIEAYPLAGVLGTICAIGAALGSPDGGTVTAIMTRFGESIWSTFAGLFAAICLMFISSLLEPGFLRLTENRLHVRETVAKAKREIASPATAAHAQSDQAKASADLVASSPSGAQR